MSNSLFHFLFIDSNISLGNQILSLNPPVGLSVAAYNRGKPEKEQFNFLLTVCSSYEEALLLIIDHNYDPIFKETLVPFDSIILEIKSSNTSYGWLNLLQDISSLGWKELNFNYGFLAFGGRINNELREVLSLYGVRKSFKRPQDLSEWKATLKAFIQLCKGSSQRTIERDRRAFDEGRKELEERSFRFVDDNNKLRRIQLCDILRNFETATTSILSRGTPNPIYLPSSFDDVDLQEDREESSASLNEE